MGSITKRGDSWRAEVRRKGFKSLCKSFASKAEAAKWVRATESSIDVGALPAELSVLTIADAVDAYRKLREKARPISDSSTEHYTIKHLDKHLGKLIVSKVTPDDLVAYAALRKDEGAGPYTVNMDISKLGTILRYAAASLRVTFPDVVGSARPLLNHLRLIGGGGRRERRPTEEELDAVMAYLVQHKGQLFADAVEFAAASAMRRGEVCQLAWEHIDIESRIATIGRKHPRLGKQMQKVPLLPRAWSVLERQKHREGLVFGCHETTLSKYFTETCRALNIPDLHLHDLRHEGTSAMFEAGMTIEQVALVTGHKDWKHLKRYANLRPEDLTRLAA